MISVSGKNWDETIINKRLVDKIRYEEDFSEIISKIIISRKFDKSEIYSINNDVELSNPFSKNKDFIYGSEILKNSIEKDEKILIIGDYDVDGCVSSSLWVNFFKQINKPVFYHIPNRIKDGYGASLNLVKSLTKKKPNLVIMVDCGSNSSESVNFLKSKNIKTIIIDHHEIYKPYPKSECLINPKKECNYIEYDYLCASSLTYFFIDFFINKNSLKIDFKKNLFYVLLASLCDVMPLRKMNRAIAKKVLNNKDLRKNFIFDEILLLKNINRPLTIDDFGFLIGPILNSAGRLDDANKVVKLITESNNINKKRIIKNLFNLNEKRKKIEDNIIKELDLSKIKNDSNNILIQYKNNFNEGLIGIIAARLKEYFDKPSVVMTKSINCYKASARSNSNFNIGKFIIQAIDKGILQNGGGHNLAAGFSIKKDKIEPFKKFINSKFNKDSILQSKHFISKISFTAINSKFYDDIKKAGPFGPQNINPIFLIENIKVINPKIINNKYVSFFAKSKSNKLISAISFNLLESEISGHLLNNKNTLNMIVQLKENLWNNKKSLQLIVLDIIQNSNNA